ncbi:purine-cytosine permease family protein [Nigerium massiliense]|uniref:purine-cytosine permease family protein n=1 Tax=Nigerium massiliense TaxID=1522317 RepID=UPI000590D0D5|nr:cytosine permease [Nigerium massiliense]
MSATTRADSAATPRAVERHGLDVIAEQDRRGRARELFWPWFSSNVSVLSVAWGSYILDFGISLAQAMAASIVGVVASFVLAGVISLAGQRGSAPTMALSRAVFGVHGNVLPGLVSYLLLLGWEIVLVSVSVIATGTIAAQLGVAAGGATQLIVFALTVATVVVVGVLGFDAVMRAQKWLGWAMIVLTAIYIAATVHRIDPAALAAHPSGSAAGVIGAGVMVLSGFGVGWTSAAADYSRYLPGGESKRAIVGWTTLGGSLPVAVLIGYGLLICGSDPALSDLVVRDPIGGLASVLPAWLVVPFWLVAMTGFVSGAIMDLYSSGLALLALGLPVQRWMAALIDGVLMVFGTIYVVWFSPDFLGPFQGFLITLGVPLAAWTGVFGADLLLRWRHGYRVDLADASGAGVGSVRWPAVLVMAVTSAIGFGLVVSAVPALSWQGYFMGALGGIDGPWASANVGVLVALVLSFVAYLPVAAREHRSR